MHSIPSKRVTAADVARSLGISRATVGFVLNDTPGQKISDATRERVLAEAKRLGYRANTAARALASGRSRIVLLVMPDWPLDHNLRTNLDEASLALDEAGYSLVTMTPHASGRAQPLWETLTPDVVMGLTPFTRKQIAQFHDAGIAHVVPATAQEDGQDVDELTDGPDLQVTHLADRGRTRLAYVGAKDPRLADLVGVRRAAAQNAAANRPGVELIASVDMDEDEATDVLHDLQSSRVDGIVAYNDDVAAWLLGAAIRSGIDVPEQIAIVGHDDAPIAHLLVPSLTSVRIDTVGLGRFFAEMALSAATGSPEPSTPPAIHAQVVVRETT